MTDDVYHILEEGDKVIYGDIIYTTGYWNIIPKLYEGETVFKTDIILRKVEAN